MLKKKYTIFHWICFWSILSIMFYATLTDWGSAGAIVSAIILVFGLIWSFCKWIVRNTIPCEVHFLIPDKQRATISYIKQDDREHKVNCLILPPNSELPILFWIKPRIVFEEIDVSFGFEGNLNEKPELIRYYNPFIYKGKKEINPGDEGHYIDYHRYYHIKNTRIRTPAQINVQGFMIQTHGLGKYEVRVAFSGHDPNRASRLYIIVKDIAEKETVKCVWHRKCYLEVINKGNNNEEATKKNNQA